MVSDWLAAVPWFWLAGSCAMEAMLENDHPLAEILIGNNVRNTCLTFWKWMEANMGFSISLVSVHKNVNSVLPYWHLFHFMNLYWLIAESEHTWIKFSDCAIDFENSKGNCSLNSWWLFLAWMIYWKILKTLLYIPYPVGTLKQIEVKKPEVEAGPAVKLGEELPNCGVKETCGPDSFPVHLFTGKSNNVGPKICVSGK